MEGGSLMKMGDHNTQSCDSAEAEAKERKVKGFQKGGH